MANKTTLSRITEKRLEAELKMLQKDPMEFIDTYPDETDKLTWYFLVRGANGTDYQDGFYIGKIMHSPEYPANPPDYMMYTPNGRFDINHKICLTNSSFHKESWSAIWNIKSLLEAFYSIMAADDTTGISHIKETPVRRKQLAKDSYNFNLTNYKKILAGFPRFVTVDNSGNVKMKSNDEIDKEYKQYLEKSKKKLKDKKSSKETKEDPKKESKAPTTVTATKKESKSDSTTVTTKEDLPKKESKTKEQKTHVPENNKITSSSSKDVKYDFGTLETNDKEYNNILNKLKTIGFNV